MLFFTQTLAELSVYTPKLLGAFLILLLGTTLARALKRIVITIFEALRVSKTVEQTPLEHFLKNADVREKIEEILGSIVYWIVMIVIVQTIASILGLHSLSEVLSRLLGYIPNVISAVLVLFFGVLLAGVVESIVKGSIRSIDGSSARLLGKVSSYLVMTLSVMIAISELGIASEFIMIMFVGLITTLTLGAGLAIGLGSKEVVTKVTLKWYEKTLKEIKE